MTKTEKSEPIRVSESQLREHWMSRYATGMVHDQQRGTRQVKMLDGTVYETPFSEIRAALNAEAAR